MTMQCRVSSLRAKLEEWTLRLDGDDVHAVGRQVGSMLWWSAFFRSINESRRLLQPSNGSLHQLINDGYFSIHAAAIRRLIDKGAHKGNRGVNSLYNLIDDIRQHADLLTRKDVLAARGLEYDYEPIRQQALREARLEAERKGEGAFAVSGKGWRDSQYWHDTWDALCMKGDKDRGPTDRPPESYFQRLLSDLEGEAKDVGEYVNKYIAHAASEASRNTLAIDQQSVSLAKLWRAERAIVRASGWVSRCFGSGSNLGGVPVPQFDQFEHLDSSFVADGAKPLMEAAWELHSSEIDKCENWDWHSPLADDSGDGEPDEVALEPPAT